MVFVRYSKNIRRHNAICRDEVVADVVENIGLKLKFSSWFSIHLPLHQLFSFYYKTNSTHKCVIIECNVLHRSVSYWESLSSKMFLYSLRKHKWIETQLWKGNSIQYFRRRPQQVSLRPLHCGVEWLDCDRWKSQTMYISNRTSWCSAVWRYSALTS